jgi:glycogen synthase
VTANRSPRVTVVMPVFNLGRYMPAALRTVRAQTFTDFELIVVDNGSTDSHTLGVLDGCRREGLTVLRITENRGPSAARNHGIAAGRGEYVVCLDPDDLLMPRFLERTVAKLNDVAAAGIATTGVTFFGRQRGSFIPPEADFVRLLCGSVIPSCSVFRRTAWEQVGGYVERTQAPIEGFEDWSFWISIVEQGWTWAVVPEHLYRFRARKGSLSRHGLSQRPRLLRELVAQHEDSYRAHVADIVVLMDERVRGLRERGLRWQLRRVFWL